MTERWLRRAIQEEAKRRGWLCVPYPQRAMGAAVGFPDLILIGDGRVVFVEAKQLGAKPSAKQEEWLKKLERRGACCVVASSVTDAFRAG